MDEFWQQALNHIQSSSSPSYRFVVPSAMVELVKDAVPYSALTSCTASQFSGLVIHKGLYQEIEPTFLFHLVKDLAPTFANDDVKNLSQIWAVAPALAKLALRDDRRGHLNKEPPWKKITEGPPSAT